MNEESSLKEESSFRKLLSIVLCIGIPVAALCCVEYYTHTVFDLTFPIFLANLCFYYLFYGLCVALTGKGKTGYLLATVCFMIFGLVNYIVMAFRSTPIVPWDIYSLQTAASVAGNYELQINSHLVVSVLVLVIMSLAGFLIRFRIGKKRVRAAGVILFVILLCLYTKQIGSEEVIDLVGLDTTLFTPKVLYRNNGLVAGFAGNMRFLRVEKPSGYRADKAEAILEKARAEESSISSEDTPNLIVVMNEAFSDPAVYGEFETDKEYMPYINGLSDNTIKGNCYVSVKGGNTANSEFEFLTGDSMAFLPTGSVPYQQYIKSETPSLASMLGQLGYQTIAIHPYNSTGWNRNTVYPLLGFDQALFKTDFDQPGTLRGYVTDQEAFQKIIDLYEEKDKDERMFVFEVTMQNHGGYSKEYDDFSESLHITDLETKSTQVRAAEKYLSLIRLSDEAFRYLTEYFVGKDEKTIIVMFGDHQPSDYITNVFQKMQNLSDTEDTYFSEYIVPYVIWANYDIEETEIGDISLNYLAEVLMDIGGFPKTEYQEYLETLRNEYPVITANMCEDKDKNRFRTDIDLLKDYRMVAYNHLCDKKNRLWSAYGFE